MGPGGGVSGPVMDGYRGGASVGGGGYDSRDGRSGGHGGPGHGYTGYSGSSGVPGYWDRR